MIRVDSAADKVNVAKVYEAKQEQIFEYWDELDASEKTRLLEQVATIDFNELGRLVQDYLTQPKEKPQHTLGDLSPPDWVGLDVEISERNKAREIGEEALRKGEVAAFLVAGGQGTRLRFDGPKGKYPIGPISERTLFQYHAERLVALGRRYRRSIPWIIMTSEANHAETTEFLEEHKYFGLRSSDVRFEVQGMLPIVDPRRGKILLQDRGLIAMSPNGHGGAIEVAQRELEFLRSRGVKYLTTFQVDNPLSATADPEFVGFHIDRGSQLTSKAVAKTEAEEKVGVFAVRGGRLQVVEYTELPESDRIATNPDGSLKFRAGNLAQHVFSLDFLDPDLHDFQMPYHVATKAISYFKDGEHVEPEAPNSVRFESFVFDALDFAETALVVEVERREEFAPVKNAIGADSPSSCRELLRERWARWFEAAERPLPRTDRGDLAADVEVAATFALDSEEFTRKLDTNEGASTLVDEALRDAAPTILLED